LPIVVFEALKFGKPVISVNVGGVCELIKNDVNGLITLTDVKSVAENISRLMYNRILYEKLSRNGMEIFKRYSDIEKNMSVFEKLINENIV